jgi:hypothetical protein
MNAIGTIAAALVGIGFLTLNGVAGAQGTDPIVGTWRIDLAKSTYKPGPPPKSATVVIEPAGKGIKVSVDAVNADGTPAKWSFTTQRDGKDVPVTGHPAYDAAATTQASPTAGTTDYKKGGKVVATTKMAVSGDGRTMTLTSTGTDPKGQAVNNVIFFRKQ